MSQVASAELLGLIDQVDTKQQSIEVEQMIVEEIFDRMCDPEIRKDIAFDSLIKALNKFEVRNLTVEIEKRRAGFEKNAKVENKYNVLVALFNRSDEEMAAMTPDARKLYLDMRVLAATAGAAK